MDTHAYDELVSRVDELFQTGEEAVAYLLASDISSSSNISLVSQLVEMVSQLSSSIEAQYRSISLVHKLPEISQNAVATIDKIYQNMRRGSFEPAMSYLELEFAPLLYFWHRYTLFFLRYANSDEAMQQWHEEEREYYRTIQKIEKEDDANHYKYDVSIVVLFYGNQKMTKKCIDAIIQHTTHISYELITFDNGSDEETTKWCESLGHAKKIHYPVNMGSSVAGNMIYSTASMYAEGKYMMFVSNDVIVTPNYDHILYNCIESDPRIAVAVPLCNSASNLQAISVSYDANNVEEIYQYGEAHNHLNPRMWYDRSRLFAILGIYRLSALELLYLGFSPLFCYDMFADDDQCCSIRRMGYRQVLCRDVFVHHYGSATIGNSQFQVMDIGREQFYQKHGVDAWDSLATAWNSANFLPLNNFTSTIRILALDPKFGEGILHIKNMLKEQGVEHIVIHAVTTDCRYLDDMAGLFDQSFCISDSDQSVTQEEYDLIVFGDVLENCHNIKAYFQLCKRLMTPNSKAIALVGNPTFIDNLIQGALNLELPGDYYLHDSKRDISVNKISNRAFHKVLKEYGFDLIGQKHMADYSKMEIANYIAQAFTEQNRDTVVSNLLRFYTCFVFTSRG